MDNARLLRTTQRYRMIAAPVSKTTSSLLPDYNGDASTRRLYISAGSAAVSAATAGHWHEDGMSGDAR